MMRTKRSRAETTDTWMERLERFRKHQGSRSEFCRREGITLTGLSYWLNRQADPVMTPVTHSRQPAFAAVEIVSDRGLPNPGSRGLPDPRWTAEFLRHLLGASS
jgi:hypothetical protein